MAAPLNLACRLSSETVPVTKGPRLVYLLLEISGGEGADTLPSNLSLIIDTSDSMRIHLVSNDQFAEFVKAGLAQEVITDGVPAYQINLDLNEQMAKLPRRIDYVIQALEIASQYLRPVDFFSLIAFSGRAQLMIPSTSGKERMRLKRAASELEYLRLGDDTQMAEGLALAFTEIQRQPDQDLASRLVLLTDGHTRNVNECYEWARKAHQAGLKLTTMGIGAEFNEELLIPLADLTGGNAYYIETPDQIPEAFRQELGAALRISYRNVEAKLNLSEGVELRRVYRVLPELSAFDQGPDLGSSYALEVGDYDPAAPRAMLIEIILPPWPPGRHRLSQVLLAWDDPASEQPRQILRQDVFIQVDENAAESTDEHVMNLVEKVGAFKMGTQALETAQLAGKNTNPEEKKVATVRLRQAATRLLDMGETLLADEMFRQAETLENNGSMDPDAAKKLRYETRRITQR